MNPEHWHYWAAVSALAFVTGALTNEVMHWNAFTSLRDLALVSFTTGAVTGVFACINLVVMRLRA